MRTFLLIHGAWHGGWCWKPLAQLLEAAGYASEIIELPGDQPGRFIGDDAAIAFEAIGRIDSDVIVVGHSLGGLVAPFVASHPRACGLVMLAALLPEFDVSAAQQRDLHPEIYTEAYRSAALIRHEDGSTEVPPAVGIDLMFNTCTPDMAELAASRLRRQYWETFGEPSPVWSWPDVPTLIVGCTEDRLTACGPMREAAQRIQGAEYLELDCDHTPMLSAPESLADLLITFADRSDLL